MMPTIRDLRIARGWTQAQLAERMPVHHRAIYFWESGKRQPNARHLQRLCEVLGVSIADVDLLNAPVSTPRGRPRKGTTDAEAPRQS